jgi:PTS system trehalose-specific IIC component
MLAAIAIPVALTLFFYKRAQAKNELEPVSA